MPDPPPPRQRYAASSSASAITPRGQNPTQATHPYAELHCRTNFSFLEGASHPDELAQQAGELKLSALAVTDRNSLAGVVRAHVAAREAGLKLLVGAEITPIDAASVVLLATDRAAYGRLATLITRGRRRAEKGECRLTFDDIAQHAGELLACVLMQNVPFEGGPSAEQGSPDTSLASPRSTERNPATGQPLSRQLQRYRDVFGDRCYGVAELHHGPVDRRLLQQWLQVSREVRVPLVAANDVHYHLPQRRYLQDVLTAIREGCPVEELGQRLFPNGERYLKSAGQMVRMFADAPELVWRTAEVANRCTFSLDELRYEYPEELCPPGMAPLEHLTRLTWDGARERYPEGIPRKVGQLIEHELQLIAELHYEAYFLTVWDLVQFARHRNILCQGRGSAANSAVCYCLGVTSVDPERIDVLFERFVSKERDEAPDIDVDFEHERREEVLQYIYQKYGRDRAGMTAEVITYRPRSAVRDVGKALGLSLDRVDALAKGLENCHDDEKLASRFLEAGLNPTSTIGRRLMTLVRQILGFPRHLSQHVGGMVITNSLLCEMVPIENAAMADRTVIQWDKNDLDALGILKVDCLALGMLTAIHRCFEMIAQHAPEHPSMTAGVTSRNKPASAMPVPRDSRQHSGGQHAAGRGTNRSGMRGRGTNGRGKPRIDPTRWTCPLFAMADIPAEDPAVYEMISRADTMGVFQIESRAQMSMLPRLRPRCFYDLVIEVAIVRPGPIQGNMVHPYLRRRNGAEPVEYPGESIRHVLQKTLGVPIFQEQAMRLAVVAAGFTPGEADQLRRAMGAWRRPGVIDQFQKKLIEGMTSNGYSAEFGERVFNQIRGFGEYGFPESHAASFALLVYVSAWLKRYYPAAFTAALLNSQPMGFYAPAQLVADTRKHGVEIRPLDVNFSNWNCTLEAIQAQETQDDRPTMQSGSPTVDRRQHARQQKPTDSRRNHSARNHGSNNRNRAMPSPWALRLGLRMIRGLSQKQAEMIERCRAEGPFVSLDDFARRTDLGQTALSRLSRADAFQSLQLNRRAALWDALPARESTPLFDDQKQHEAPVALPTMSALSEVIADYRSAGLSLRGHPMQFLRRWLDEQRAVPAERLAQLPSGRRVRVAGLVLLRQRPGTASGITFVSLEDETGIANLIIRPEVWERFHRAARTAQVMLVWGVVQRDKQVIHVLVEMLEDVSIRLADMQTQSRDFR